MNALGYVRLGPDIPVSQEKLIREFAKSAGLRLVGIETDSRGRIQARTRAMARLKAREAELLVVAKLVALARSSTQFSALVTRLHESGAHLVALDAELDTGSQAAHGFIDALRLLTQLDVSGSKSRRGTGRSRGRRPMNEATRQRILRRNDDGWSFGRIARELNQDGVATAQGGKMWYASTIKAVVDAEKGSRIRR